MTAEEATFQNLQSEDTTLSPKEKLSPEAESISRVLVNSISQLKIAASLPAILQFYSESGVQDQDLSRALQAHQVLVERLKKLEAQQQKQTKKEKGTLVQLKNDVKNSVRDILRYFRNHPDVLSGLMAELNVAVGESESMVIGNLEMFHDHIVKNQISGPEKKPNKTADEPRKLQLKLVQLDKEIFDKDFEIRNLQKYVDMLDKEEKKTSALVKKKDEAKVMSSSSEVKTGNQETDQLKAQLKNLMIENQKTQRKLRKENEELEMKIESLLQTSDKDMEKHQAELEVAEQKYEKVQEDVKLLQESFSLLEVKSNEIQEKWRLAEERRQEELKDLESKNKHAAVIQARWRDYRDRKALESMNKDKSKEDKSKKGKKTKKSNIKGKSKKKK